MGIEVLDSSSDLNNVILEGAIDDLDDSDEGPVSEGISLDARRRLENRIEELRLRKEVQEFDFNF
ncbi:hypothetical protein SAMN02745866_02337 [Alteromonadaceae bacterium Bs31]|nr:hypothetical protein SAMN02745866_02337 [Alteromonadaceae bacterium Bs31]